MAQTSYGSLYSVFVFVLAFSIINFYVTKIKEDKRMKLQILKKAEEKKAAAIKFDENWKATWNDVWMCNSNSNYQATCHSLEIFSETRDNFVK